MRSSNIRVYLIYFLLISYLLFINFFGYEMLSNNINTVFNPLFWLSLASISFFINKNTIQRIVLKTSKIQTILIIVLIYLILYFTSGLFLGYSRSIYNHSLLGILLNIWIYISIIIFQEYVRNTLIRNNYRLLGTIIIAVIFILYDIKLSILLQSFINPAEVLKQTSMIVVPSIASNILFMYASKTSGYEACLVYRIPLILTTILLPILPSWDWYLMAVGATLLPLITFILIKDIHDKKTIRESRRFLRKQHPAKLIPIFAIIVVFIGFVAGIFKYKPISIASNSMYPIIERGDAIVFEKLSDSQLDKLKNYDIIVYKLDNIIIVHRIIAIDHQKDGTVLYTTKGDNNNMVDLKKVKKEQILGVVSFNIPKVGLPSIWLSEFFNENEIDTIETGK